MNTFSSLCIGACVFMIFVGMSFGFIGAMTGTYDGRTINAFPSTRTSPIDTSDGDLDIIENLTSNVTGTVGTISFNDIWLIATGATVGVAITLSILTGTTNMIGAWLFGSFFWSSWLSIIGILYTFDFLKTGAGLILVTMITIGMTIMFIGAIIGMLSGTHSLR